MKKNILSFVLLLVVTAIFAQDDNQPLPKYEIKGNAFNLLIFKAPEISFEYLLNADAALGASLLINLENLDEEGFNSSPYYQERFAFTPYYRRYFSSKYAQRFFFESFVMFNKQEDVVYNYDYDFETNTDRSTFANEQSTNLAVGIAIGSKFTSPGGFLFEFYGGVGKNILTSNDVNAFEFVPRLGVSLGHRF